MRSFAAFTLCALVVTSNASLKAKWSSFKSEHGKNYAAHEEDLRVSAFLDSDRLIQEHNERYARGEETYFLRHNHLSDLTPTEYESMLLKEVPSGLMANFSLYEPKDSKDIPESFDARKHNLVTPVRGQGSCGSCYCFATAAALETNFAKAGRPLVSISEQGIMDCSNKFGTKGCNGGGAWPLMQYIRAAEGFNHLEGYPYEAKLGTCRFKETESVGKASNARLVPVEDEKAMAEAVSTHGAVVSMMQSPREFSFHGGGIYNPTNCRGVKNYHAVAVIGYGTEDGVDYWLIKNSWRTVWGEKGFGKVIRGKNICGVASASVIPIA